MFSVGFAASVLTLASIYGVLTVALNLQFGLGGLVNFGIVAYFAIGAFSYAIVTQPSPGPLDQYRLGLEWPWWAGILLAMAAGVAFAVITGWPTLRLRGEYLALVTFAFAEVLNSVLVNEPPIANGSRGLSNLLPPFYYDLSESNYDLQFGALMFGFLIVSLLIAIRISRSPFGRTLQAVRDDELAAAALGKDAKRFRLKIFVVGAVMATLGGVAYAWYATLVAPGLFTAEVTFLAFIALVLGGVGSNIGAVVGAFLIVWFDQALVLLPLSLDNAQMVSSLRLVPYGLLLILVLRFRRSGLLGGRAP